MERIGHYKSYIQGPKLADISSFLYDLSLSYDCELTILDKNKGFWFETIYFKFSGNESNLLKTKQAIEEAIEEFNEPAFESKKYKVINTSIVTDHFHNTLNVSLDANKMSHVTDLIKKAAEHTNGTLVSFQQKNNGFLKGKNIDTKIFFDSSKKMNKFLTIFENHIVSKNIKKSDQLASFKM